MLLSKDTYKLFSSMVQDEHIKNIYALAECNSNYTNKKICNYKLQIQLLNNSYYVIDNIISKDDDVDVSSLMNDFGFKISDGRNTGFIANNDTLIFENQQGVNVQVNNNKVSFSLKEHIDDFNQLVSGNEIILTKSLVRIISVFRNGVEQFEGTNNDYIVSFNKLIFTQDFSISEGGSGSESVKVIYIYK